MVKGYCTKWGLRSDQRKRLPTLYLYW